MNQLNQENNMGHYASIRRYADRTNITLPNKQAKLIGPLAFDSLMQSNNLLFIRLKLDPASRTKGTVINKGTQRRFQFTHQLKDLPEGTYKAKITPGKNFIDLCFEFPLVDGRFKSPLEVFV